jgi:ParB-like chromosome segregation protein Spo0J
MNGPRHDLRVELLTISRLKQYDRNPRTHSAKQIKQIASSIKSFGFTNPILIDGDDVIIAGHGRLEALKLLGHRLAPVIRLENLSESQKRAYVLADNKLTENAGWDRSLLAVELEGLLEVNLDFEIGALGFETGEIDSLLGELSDPPVADPDRAIEDDQALPPVTQPGDLWALGRHRLLCADALEAESYTALRLPDTDRHALPGRTQALPGSDTILSCVMRS